MLGILYDVQYSAKLIFVQQIVIDYFTEFLGFDMDIMSYSHRFVDNFLSSFFFNV